MTTFYDIDRANERLPELARLLEGLRDQREQVIHVRDEMLALRAAARTGEAGEGGGETGGSADDDPAELRRLELRLKALVDQMQAAVGTIDGWGITLRDIPTGLVDFPALVSGRQVWLCWRLGEDEVGAWHELESGFSSRRPLAELA